MNNDIEEMVSERSGFIEVPVKGVAQDHHGSVINILDFSGPEFLEEKVRERARMLNQWIFQDENVFISEEIAFHHWQVCKCGEYKDSG